MWRRSSPIAGYRDSYHVLIGAATVPSRARTCRTRPAHPRGPPLERASGVPEMTRERSYEAAPRPQTIALPGIAGDSNGGMSGAPYLWHAAVTLRPR
jgi:hypothetical protein